MTEDQPVSVKESTAELFNLAHTGTWNWDLNSLHTDKLDLYSNKETIGLCTKSEPDLSLMCADH